MKCFLRFIAHVFVSWESQQCLSKGIAPGENNKAAQNNKIDSGIFLFSFQAQTYPNSNVHTFIDDKSSEACHRQSMTLSFSNKQGDYPETYSSETSAVVYKGTHPTEIE